MHLSKAYLLKDNYLLFEDKDLLLQCRDTLSKDKYPLRECTDPLLKGRDLLPKDKDPLRECKDLLPECRDPLLKGKDLLLKDKDPLSKCKDPLREGKMLISFNEEKFSRHLFSFYNHLLKLLPSSLLKRVKQPNFCMAFAL